MRSVCYPTCTKIEQYFKYTDRPTQACSCVEIIFKHAFRDLSTLETTDVHGFSVMIMCIVCCPTCTHVKLKSSNISSTKYMQHNHAIMFMHNVNINCRTHALIMQKTVLCCYSPSANTCVLLRHE